MLGWFIWPEFVFSGQPRGSAYEKLSCLIGGGGGLSWKKNVLIVYVRIKKTALYLKWNSEGLSNNRWCSGKGMRIIYRECMCVSAVLVSKHAKRMRRVILQSVACPAVPCYTAVCGVSCCTVLYCSLWRILLYRVILQSVTCPAVPCYTAICGVSCCTVFFHISS